MKEIFGKNGNASQEDKIEKTKPLDTKKSK